MAKRRIDQLSGGQMRRVVLAGLLARSPRALILDEPLAGLDAASQRGLVRLLEELRREQGLTVVVISHDFAGWRSCARAPWICATACCTRSRRQLGDVVTTAPTRRTIRTPAVSLGRAAASRCPAAPSVHDLWAGTKLLAVGGISVLLTFYPGWMPIGLVAALVLTAARLAHIPRGALPTVPHWLWILLVLGGMSAAFAGGSPMIHMAGVRDRTRRAAELPADHRVVDRAARAGGDGVVDHQCRRNRACGSQLWAGRCGGCGSRSTSGPSRSRWRCVHSRC